jgi:Glycosyl transferase 4-like domain
MDFRGMKKVLIITYYFPPIAASGALRPLGFCRYLERHGWLPRVLTTQPSTVYPSVDVDQSLSTRFPAHLRVDRVPDGNPISTLIRLRDQARQKMGNFFNPANSEILPIGHPIEPVKTNVRGRFSVLKGSIVERLFLFPDPQCFWRRPAIQRLWRLPSHARPEAVFASGGPWTSLLVGKALAQRFGVPFIADFRDPWTQNPYKPLSPARSRQAKRLEQAICTAAAAVVSTTVELSAAFRNSYPALAEKFMTITNGFDSEAPPSVVDTLGTSERLQPVSPARCGMELSHFGTVYGNRNPLPLLQAVKALLEEGRLTKDQLRLRFVGDWLVVNDACDRLARVLEAHGVLRREPAIPHDECLRQMASTPVLLILQPASPLQIPAKIYEYIFAGRPLLVVGGEGATSNLVRRHRLGTCCANEVTEIMGMLRRIVQGEMVIEPPQQAARAHFDYNLLTAELAALLDSVCALRPGMARAL